MKTLLLSMIFGFAALSASAQAPTITGDTMLCPDGFGTASITTDMPYDSYQWQWKYWFTSDPFVPIPNADGPFFTYDWMTYDQALLKVVVTLDGQTYESNTIQIDSYAWVGLTMGYQDEPEDNIEYDPDSGNLMLCEGTGFTLEVYMPYTEVQWYRNGQPIAGANEMQLHVTQEGSYHVVAAPGFCPNSTSSTEGLPIVVAIDNNCNLGVNNPGNDTFAIYPNPVSSQFHFSSQTPIEQLTIYNLTGQKVLQHKPAMNSGTVDTSMLASGMYIVEAASSSGTQQTKILKN